MRATARIAGVARNTIDKLLVELGAACSKFHAAAVSLHMMYYNFGRVHMTLKTSPAVAAGVADHVWTVEEIVALLDSN